MLGITFEMSEEGSLAGNPFHGGGKQLGTYSGERVLLRADRVP